MDRELENSERLIAALRSPAVWGNGVQSIRVLETHISWVLLTGESAYKIKKPVDLGFLDFSTLEKREHFCREEVRLNRRLAAEFYLGVVPITGTVQAPRVGGPGEAIEYAVRMREFPQDALLSRVLRRGELQPSHVDALAGEMAAFHRSAAVAGEGGPFGSVESVWQPMEENFEHLKVEPDTADAGRIEPLREWAWSELSARRTEFAARQRDGFVRECHGDMHLGNMFLWDGRVVIFDCIEFNESLRWIDVLSEAAFAVMDLQDRGRPDFAHRLLNAYLERTGDYAGLGVLRYYLAYRALVRAKVARIRAAQDDLAAEERARVAAEFSEYLDLAEQYAAGGRPRLIITHGASGSGKTTWTQRLLEQLGAVRIRSDVERKRLFGIEPLSRGEPGELYSPAASEQTYSRLSDLADAVLRAGWTAVVDATFLRRERREAFRGIAERAGVPFTILDFPMEPELLRERVRRRAIHGQDASDADVAVLEAQLRARDPLSDEERASAIAVNEHENTEEIITTLSWRGRSWQSPVEERRGHHPYGQPSA